MDTSHLSDDDRWRIALAKDRRFDGAFVTGVHSTGIYCRPSCPARHPKRENVRFFANGEEARAAGLRPCIENFDEVAPIMLNRAWREASARPALRGLITEILAWPDMPGRLAFPDYDAPNTPLMLMKLRVGDVRLSLFTTITTFGTPQDVTTDELRVESFFPADEDSARVLRALASRAA